MWPRISHGDHLNKYIYITMVSDASVTIVCFRKPHEYSSNFCTNLERVGETCTLTLFQRSIQQDHIKAVCRMRIGGKTLNACQGHGSEKGQAKRTRDTENTSAVTDADTNAQAVSNIPSALKRVPLGKALLSGAHSHQGAI